MSRTRNSRSHPKQSWELIITDKKNDSRHSEYRRDRAAAEQFKKFLERNPNIKVRIKRA